MAPAGVRGPSSLPCSTSWGSPTPLARPATSPVSRGRRCRRRPIPPPPSPPPRSRAPADLPPRTRARASGGGWSGCSSASSSPRSGGAPAGRRMPTRTSQRSRSTTTPANHGQGSPRSCPGRRPVLSRHLLHPLRVATDRSPRQHPEPRRFGGAWRWREVWTRARGWPPPCRSPAGSVPTSGSGSRPDLIAGVVVAALIVPKNLGYAGIAGIPLQNGLYAAAAGAILYAIFGTCRQISMGPSSGLAAVAAGAVLAAGVSGEEASRPSSPASPSPPGCSSCCWRC